MIYLSTRAPRDSPSEFLGGFIVSLDREIYFPGGVMLLCTMMLCGSYIKVGTKVTLGAIMIT